MKPVVMYSKVAPDGTVTVQLPIEYAGSGRGILKN